MSANSKRTLHPVNGFEGKRHSPTAIRDTVCERLRMISVMVGSISTFASEIGVNRTQLSRYLSGQSVPRPELLVTIATTYDIPLNWLVTPHDDPNASLSEYQLSGRLHELFANRRFQLTENMLPSGLYMFWKGLFQQPGKYEGYMSSVKLVNGIGTVRTIMIRDLKRQGIMNNPDIMDYFCTGVAVKSQSGINITFSDSVSNVMASTFLLPSAPLRFRSNDIYSGFMMLSYTPGRQQVNWVPCVMELLPPNVSDVLAAARTSGRYNLDELPDEIRHQIERLEVPEYGLR